MLVFARTVYWLLKKEGTNGWLKGTGLPQLTKHPKLGETFPLDGSCCLYLGLCTY